MFSKVLFMSSSTLKFPKVVNLFVISNWYCFLNSRSLTSCDSIFSLKTQCCLFIYCKALRKFCNQQIVISITVAPLKLCTSGILECHLLSINMWSIWFWVLKTIFFDVAKFNILTSLSLLFRCRLSNPTVGLKIFSLLNFPLISHK